MKTTMTVAQEVYSLLKEVMEANPGLDQKRKFLVELRSTKGFSGNTIAAFERIFMTRHPRAKLIFQ